MKFLSQLKKIFTDQRNFQLYHDAALFQTNDSTAMSLPRQQENTMITAQQATELTKNSERYIKQLQELKIEEHIINAANCGNNVVLLFCLLRIQVNP